MSTSNETLLPAPPGTQLVTYDLDDDGFWHSVTPVVAYVINVEERAIVDVITLDGERLADDVRTAFVVDGRVWTAGGREYESLDYFEKFEPMRMANPKQTKKPVQNDFRGLG